MNRFELFIRERRYLLNVSEHTVSWYTCALKWLPSESPSQAELKDVVVKMREKGLKETGCNAAIRAINAYLHWNSETERKCGAGCTHPRIRPLKEPQVILPTFTDEQVKRLISWKPGAKHYYERRLHLLVLLLFDLGCRISEATGLRVSDINLDDLLATLNGKGRKQRIVPFSFVLRKALHRFIADFKLKPVDLVFSTADGVQMNRMVALREVKALCVQLGFTAPRRTLHSFRHLFAVNYLRRGGSLFHLQKSLGHSSLEMTRRYANLVTADLQAVHERVSLLSR
ncbi:tyrosine-type recombinase/integrase [Edaphobacter sp. HDX4]|uniref:tyrosine-type recombinase/integrase n=1 Tax=Edaphobacter sp. HDX4 TaxID=2794064 RepID=UPI002FE6B2C2